MLFDNRVLCVRGSSGSVLDSARLGFFVFFRMGDPAFLKSSIKLLSLVVLLRVYADTGVLVILLEQMMSE